MTCLENFKKELLRQSRDSDVSMSEVIIRMDKERPKSKESRAITAISNFKDIIIPILIPFDKIQSKDMERFDQVNLSFDMFTDLALMTHMDIKLLISLNNRLKEIWDDIKEKTNGKK